MSNHKRKKSSLLPKDKYEHVKKYYHYLRGKRYSDQTVKVYGTIMVEFLLFLKDEDIYEITNRTVEEFSEQIIVQRNLSISYQRQFIGAIKLFAVLNKLEMLNPELLVRPKKARRLPAILSQKEVLTILQKTRNIKHKTILALIYSAGLRISELINLKISDIDIDRKQIRIEQAKGRKDRYVVLPDSFILLYVNYMNAYEPSFFVIESLYGNKYSSSSVRKFLKKSCNVAGISKHVTPHTLRHSYATHLLENGVDIRYIQELLGHRKPETTMIYTHVQRKDLIQIKSPLDIIVEEGLKSTKELLSGNNPDI